MKEVKDFFIQRLLTNSYALTPSKPIQATTSSIQNIYFKEGYCEASVLNNQFWILLSAWPSLNISPINYS
jgi:hypothetical protein